MALTSTSPLARFDLAAGEILGIVGESGSGKSTLGRCVLRLIEPTAGSISFAGRDLRALSASRLRVTRADMQIVFQDPWSALNPRLSIRSLIEEPLRLHSKLRGRELRARAEELADRVRIDGPMLDRFSSDLSGGQLQRVCIARAIATEPKLIVLDEPTSSLDVSIRAGILELLHELRAELNVAAVFISHDLATLRLISDRIAVLYLGQIVETGPSAAVFDRPAHPYTAALMSAHLSPDPRQRGRRAFLKGEAPSPIDLPPGCYFAPRCPLVRDDCLSARPQLVPAGPEQSAACTRVADHTNILQLPGD
jgi:oligopeptide/dipeptide ABC transporter ATP-binding protein